MITSSQNPSVRYLIELRDRAKIRNAEGKFLAEGTKMFLEAPEHLIEEVWFREGFSEGSGSEKGVRGEDLILACLSKTEKLRARGVKIETLAEGLFSKISDTKTPQGILFVCRKPSRTLEEMLDRKDAKNLLFLEDLQDPGNLGTIIRTAEGAGIRGILMTEDCVDLFNPKVVRATMGSLFRVPIMETKEPAEFLKELKRKGFQILASRLDGTVSYDEADYSKESVILVGNEARGLSEKISEESDVRVIIPMKGSLESLNAAVAAALLMYRAG